MEKDKRRSLIMKTVKVNVSKSYDVVISSNILDKIGTICKISPCKAAIISDDKVFPLYGERVKKSLEEAGFFVVCHIFKNGEKSKNITEYAKMLEFLAENHITASDCIFALGGGVCGDMSGFSAATYLRGMRFVQIPTTFLAAVDSSVGGKTGINLGAGKNLAGAFHQPSFVLCDTDTFKTLDKETYSDGVAEAIKCGMIRDKALFEKMQGDYQEDIESVITSCIEVKRCVVEADEFDKGERRLLNFGHTIGHAIEKLSDYEITHGHAVAMGMAIVTKAAYKTGFCDKSVCDALTETLTKCALPTSCPYTAEEIAKIALSDKKRSGDTVAFVLPKEIGNCVIHNIKTDEICDFIEKGLN